MDIFYPIVFIRLYSLIFFTKSADMNHMNTYLWFLMLLPTVSLGTTLNLKVVKQLQSLDKISPEVACVSEENPYTPQEAIKDINSGKLTFMGREKFPGSAQNYTCVYKSDRAYILYHNCMANKKESPTMDMEIISFEGDITSFYVENAKTDIPVSERVRSQYDMSWRVSYTPSPPAGKMTIPEIMAFREKHDESSGGCFIGSTFKAKEMDSKVQCFSDGISPDWGTAAESFWKEPGEDWYKTKKYLRTVINDSKF